MTDPRYIAQTIKDVCIDSLKNPNNSHADTAENVASAVLKALTEQEEIDARDSG